MKRLLSLLYFLVFPFAIIKAECLPVLGLGSEIRICQGSSVILNAQNPGASYQWSTGATSQTIVVNQPGVYWVAVTNNCGTARDTVTVHVDQHNPLNFGGVIGLCPTSTTPLVFRLPPGFSSLWSDNSTADSLVVSTPGIYWGQVNNACGVFRDTFEVVYSTEPIFNLGPDTTICSGRTLRLSIPPGLGNISWSNGSTGNSMNVAATGWYWATVSNTCGSYTDSIHVTVLPTPQIILSSEIGTCQGDPVPLTALSSLPPNTTVSWSNNTTGNSTIYNSPGNHFVIVNGPCIQDTFHFEIVEVTPLSPIDLGNDTILCGKITIHLDPLPPPGTAISWHDGSSKDSVVIDTYTQVYVTLSNACNTVTDTMMVYTMMPPDTLMFDTIEICPNNFGIHSVSGPNGDSLRFLWSNGDTNQFTFPTQPGWLSVLAYNRCDTLVDSVYIDVIPDLLPFTMPNDTTLCEMQGFYIDATDSNGLNSDAFSYRWFRDGIPQHNSPQIYVNRTGTYVLIKTNTCDTIIDSIHVTVIPLPRVVMLPLLHACVGDTVWLEPDTNGTFFQWNNNYPDLRQPVTQSGTYSVIIANSCDTITDSIQVVFEHPFPFFTHTDSIVVCEGPVQLFAPLPNQRYRWFNGWFTNTWTVHTSGKYWVETFNACDTVVDSITVLITGPPASMMGTFVTVCRGNSVLLDARNWGSTYLWHADSSTNRTFVASDPGWYYVDIENDCGFLTDSIEVIVVDPVELELGKDTILCEGETYTLNAGNDYSTYRWNTGDTTRIITVDTTGWYVVEISNVCNTRTDSVLVTFLGVPVFDMDTVFKCYDADFVTVFGPTGNLTYSWSNGDSLPFTRLSDEGWHYLEIDNGCFSYRDSFLLETEYPLELSLGNDTIICASNAPFILTAHVPTRHTVRWNDDHEGHTFEVHTPGLYSAAVWNSCGVFGDSIYVGFDEELPDEIREQILCKGDTFTLNLAAENHRHVEWFDGDTSLERIFINGGTYHYRVTNKCGVFDQTLQLNEENCMCPFYVPNSFTPNNDGVNDLFAYGYDCEITSFHIQISNRWGQLVFQTSDPTHFWDGTQGGNEAPLGTYIYSIDIHWRDYDKDMHRRIFGMVTIIR